MDNFNLKRRLSDRELAILSSEMQHHRKSGPVSYLLWFFLGMFGAHRFYLGNTTYGVILLVSFLLNVLFGWITLYLSFLLHILWVFIDVFFIHPSLVQTNQQIERRIIYQLGLGEGPRYDDRRYDYAPKGDELEREMRTNDVNRSVEETNLNRHRD